MTNQEKKQMLIVSKIKTAVPLSCGINADNSTVKKSNMRKVTQKIIESFLCGRSLKLGNTETDGIRVWLHGNRIIEERADGIYICDGGWQTNTTKERLNGLKCVHITQKNFQWFLNGEEWNGEWTRVCD